MPCHENYFFYKNNKFLKLYTTLKRFYFYTDHLIYLTKNRTNQLDKMDRIHLNSTNIPKLHNFLFIKQEESNDEEVRDIKKRYENIQAAIQSEEVIMNETEIRLHTLRNEETSLIIKLNDLKVKVCTEKDCNEALKKELAALQYDVHLRTTIKEKEEAKLINIAKQKDQDFVNYLKALNVKFSIKQKTVLNSKIIAYEIDIHYTKINLLYNIVNHSFELLKITPTHKNFEKLKLFLYQNDDICGFLATLRLLAKAISKKPEV